MAKQVIMKFNQDGALVQADSSAVGIRQGDSNGEVTFVAIFQGGRNDQCVAKLNFTRPDGKRLQNIVMQPSASSIDRFNYAALSAWFFAVAGNASATVTITDASGAIAAQGAYTFAIAATDAEPSDTTITYDEAAELEGIVANVSAASLKRAHGLTIDEPTVSAFYSAVLGYYGESAILDGDRFSAEYQNSESSTTTFLGEFFGDDKFIVLMNTSATVDGETQYDRHMYLVVGDAEDPTITEFAAKAYVDAFFDQYGNALHALADEDGLSIKNGYVKKSQIVDNLYTTASNQPLSAYQGSILKNLIDQLSNYIYQGAANASIDRLAEVFAFLAGHDDDETLDGILAGKVSKTDIVDGLSTADPTKVLSANQGVALDARIAALEQSQGQLNDNYYTKTETNALLANKQNALTFDSEPTEGSTNPVTSGGVFSAMGNVVAIANGKCKAYVMNRNINIAYLKSLINEGYEGLKIVDAEGNDISQAVWDGDYDNVNLSDVYDAFYRNDRKGFDIDEHLDNLGLDHILLASGGDSIYANTTYILDRVLKFLGTLNIGDTIYIIDVDVPDWWYSNRYYFSVLETQKVDLTDYYTKLQADALLAGKLALSFAGASPYDDTATYPLGATCTQDAKVYRCTTPIDTPEAWNPAHWVQVTLNDYAKLGSAQTFTAKQTFGEIAAAEISGTANGNGFLLDTANYTTHKGNLRPDATNTRNIGTSYFRYKEGFINKITDAGGSYSSDNVINVINASDIVNNTLTEAQLNIIINGKMTRIAGYTAFVNASDPLLFSPSELGQVYQGLYITGGTYPTFGMYQITKSSGLLTNISSSTRRFYLNNVLNINGKSLDYYLNNVYPYATNSTTELKFETVNVISISADTTFTLATAPADTYPEYKANIANSGASDITITLPSGTSIKGNVSISSNTFVIPAGSEVELNIQNNKAIVVEW